MSNETSETKKRRGTSIPLLIGFLILGAVGYVFGESIMTYAFYLQEVMIASSGSKGADVPAGITPEPVADPNVGPGPGLDGPGAGGPGGGGSGGGPGGGNMDPEALFADRDKDSNGKLEGDEISERMQARLAEVDTDQDKAVSKEEFLTAFRNRQSSGGGGGGGGQRPASDDTPSSPPTVGEATESAPPTSSSESSGDATATPDKS